MLLMIFLQEIFLNILNIMTTIVFKEYSPEKFYLLNKIIIQYTKTHYNEYNRFIFINAWNEWGEGSYLEPDDKYG